MKTGRKPLKPCKHPGCRNLTTTRHCEIHKSEGKPWASKHKPKRLKGRKSQERRLRIAERDVFICQMCGRPTTNGIADHIIPLAFGGKDDEDNMQWLCIPCHQKKSIEEKKGRERGADDWAT